MTDRQTDTYRKNIALVKCIRRYALSGPLIIFVLVRHNSIHFHEDMRENDFYISFSVILNFNL